MDRARFMRERTSSPLTHLDIVNVLVAIAINPIVVLVGEIRLIITS